MIEQVNTHKIQDFLEKSSSGRSNSAGALPGDDADVSVQVDYASLIDRAMQTPQTDIKAVQQAKELLLSGQLESKENIQKTAKDIVNLGL